MISEISLNERSMEIWFNQQKKKTDYAAHAIIQCVCYVKRTLFSGEKYEIKFV